MWIGGAAVITRLSDDSCLFQVVAFCSWAFSCRSNSYGRFLGSSMRMIMKILKVNGFG